MNANTRSPLQMYFDKLGMSEESDAAAISFVRALITISQEWQRWTRPLIKIFLFPHSERGKRGRKPETNFFRDRDIALAIYALQEVGYNPTSNSESKHICGCSIVAEALREYSLSTRGVESIWRRRFHLAKLEASATNRWFNTYD